MNTADSNEDYEGSYPPSKNESRSQSKQDLHTIGGGSSVLDQPVRDLLVTARTILELGLKNVSSARQVVALNDGKSIADISWSKVGVLDCRKTASKCGESSKVEIVVANVHYEKSPLLITS